MWLRLYKAALTGCAFLCLAPPCHPEPAVPTTTDLQRDGQLARERRLPLLLDFSSTDCPYCQQVEQDFLVPLLISGAYRDRVLVRRLLVTSGTPVTDFDGVRRKPGELVQRYQARVTPTLVFLDGKGRELTEHLVGISTPELYGGYLDACIDTALLQIRAPDQLVAYAGCSAAHAR